MKYGAFIESKGSFAQELRFLAKAVSGDETRYFMNHIFIEPSMLPDEWWKRRGEYKPIYRGVATDGRRLHIVDPMPNDHEYSSLCAGFWHVVSNKASCVQIAYIPDFQGQFPQYEKVIQREDPLQESEFSGFSLSGRRTGESSREISKFFRSFPEPTPINLTYIADLGIDTPWKVEWRGAKKGVTFKSGNKTAIIMPMQAED